MKLESISVGLTNDKHKSKRKKNSSRAGYKDENGQVFLPPSSAKRTEFWKKKMEERKFTFA